MALEEQMANLQLRHTGESAVAAPKKLPCLREGKEKVNALTNVFPLYVVPKRIYRYEVSVQLVTTMGGTVDLVFRGDYSNEVSERRKVCMYLVDQVFRKYNIIREDHSYIYDGSATVFCTDDLCYVLDPFDYRLPIGRNEARAIRYNLHLENIQYFLVEVKKNDQCFFTDDYLMTQTNRAMDTIDRSLRNFFELLISFDAVKNGNFHSIGGHKMFETNTHRVDLLCGHERAYGFSRTIKFIEGSDEGYVHGVVPAVIIDAKTSDFYKTQNLRTSVIEVLKYYKQTEFPFFEKEELFQGQRQVRLNNYWQDVNMFVKDLRMNRPDVDIEGRCSFIATGITKYPISKFEYSDQNSPEYKMRAKFDDKWSRVDVSFPAVIFRASLRGRDDVRLLYPMEALTVAGGQSVPIDEAIVDMDKAIKPDVRLTEIMKQLRVLNLHDGGVHNETLSLFGVKVSDAVLNVTGVLREKPQVGYSNKGEIEYVFPKEQGQWNKPFNCVFVKPAIIRQLFIIGELAICRSVKEDLARSCRNMRVDQCFVWNFCHDEENTHCELNKMFALIASKEIPDQLVIFIDPEENRTHDDLKLLERQYLIRTMHMTRHIASVMKNRPATLDNIINKINEKAGGVNHTARPDQYGRQFWDDCLMFIGYDVSHPAPDVNSWSDIEPPSVVGFSFNGGSDKSAFIGDFHYQRTRQEKVSPKIIRARMQWMLRVFHQSRLQLPSIIFILRDGVSDGQIAMVMKDEFLAFQDGVKDYRKSKPYSVEIQDWAPKFVLIVVTKRHNLRIFTGSPVNTNPGTVIDTTIVRSDINEFFMQSHRVIQGTGKLPSYCVVVDDLNLANDTIQALMYALTYMHKIVMSPVSLPEPIYQADEYAKRGNNLFNGFVKRHKMARYIIKDGTGTYGRVPLDCEELTKTLAFWNTPLETFRVNA